MSLLDRSILGSALSLRSFARIGSSISIMGAVTLGNDLRFFEAGKGIHGMKADGTTTRRISFPEDSAGQGILHGSWIADQSISTSDRRLKKAITPLYKTLASRMVAQVKSATPIANAMEQRSQAITWVLRELRPVSFSFRDGMDSKSMNPRFGFVAQEVERVLPELVHDNGQTKYMIYQDLIAMITLAAQDHQVRLERNRGEVSKLRGLVNELAGTLGHLSQRVAGIVAEPPGTAAPSV